MLSNTRVCRPRLCANSIGALCVLLAGGAFAQTPQGPAPTRDGQTEGLLENAVTGAVNAIAASPVDSDVVFVGTVNGGIWRSTLLSNETQAWIPQTGDTTGQSIGDIVFDTADATYQTLVAGVGRFSSYGRRGGSLTGLLRTEDGGQTWTQFGGQLASRNVSKLAVNGDSIVVAVNFAEPFECNLVGVYFSTDGGDSFTLANFNDNGLPLGVSTGLAADPSNPAVLYASVIFAETCDGASSGIYRTADSGQNWVKVSNASMDAITNDASGLIEIEIAADGRVVVAISESGQLSGVFYSDDDGQNWTATDLPGSNEPSFVGVHAGGQASIHFSLAIDPTDSDIIYVGGDRQPLTDSGGFPNSLGAFDFSGRLFRGDVSAPAGSQWTPLTHSGTASFSAPHADSRDMAFDADGELLEADDGGIYRRVSPRSVNGDWVSLNGAGSLQITEAHNMAYDENAGVLLTGNQDTGTSQQNAPLGLPWNALQNGDGGDVAVDTQTLQASNQSIRYSSFQFLSALSRRVFDQDNNFISFTSVPLVAISGPSLSGQFTTPLVLNQVNQARLIIGASEGVYESFDLGDTVAAIGPGIVINGFDGRAVAYGSAGSEDLLFVGDGDTLYRRQNLGEPLLAVAGGNGSAITAIALHPDDASQVFYTDGDDVFHSVDGGDSFTTITGNINTPGLPPVGRIRALEFVAGPQYGALFAGADRAIRATTSNAGFNDWSAVTVLEPNALVYEFDYDPDEDRLYVGTLGRGAFSIAGAVASVAPDTDGDGVSDAVDNCTIRPNDDQRDTDGDGIGNACDADLNQDCVINAADLGLLKSVFFSADGNADFNGDGTVNFTDLGILKDSFFQAPGPSANACSPSIEVSNGLYEFQNWSSSGIAGG